MNSFYISEIINDVKNYISDKIPIIIYKEELWKKELGLPGKGKIKYIDTTFQVNLRKLFRFNMSLNTKPGDILGKFIRNNHSLIGAIPVKCYLYSSFREKEIILI